MRGAIALPASTFTASMPRDIKRGNPVEANHVVGDLIARGTPEGVRLLRTACLHLKAHEARRARRAREAG